MKAKIGMIFESEYGSGPIIAMTKSWCIHEVDGYEAAVEWTGDDWVKIKVEPPEGVEGGFTEMEVE